MKSQAALTMFYWLANAKTNIADNEKEAEYCLSCARLWAASIIAGTD